MLCDAPIGLFDSGVGGLSVMREVRRLLPAEDLYYFADSAYCPYGGKTVSEIRARALAMGEYLIALGAKMLVIASNTTSSAALETLRRRYPVPVVGMEPALKPAAAATRNNKVGVLATRATLYSDRFSTLVGRFGDDLEVITQPCPGLVELVEAGQHQGTEARDLLVKFVAPLLERGADTIVLGCTHYPFFKPLIQRLAGPEVKIIDTGEAVARQVATVLARDNQAAKTPGPGRESFYTSGEPELVEPVIRQLWGDPELLVERARI